VIDVWDIDTFDTELRSYLEQQSELIRNFWAESRRLFEEREKQTVRGFHEQNVFGPPHSALRDDITVMMGKRTIRAWHYTRLTDGEAAGIQANGMLPMSLDLIRRRLDVMVEAGELTSTVADNLFAASPYHEQIEGNRNDKIWLSSQPFEMDDSMVTGLVTGWGGESLNFVHQEGPIAALLASIGRPRVIEFALPLRITTRIDSAAKDVVDAYSFALGCEGAWGGGSDIVAVESILPEWIVAIHSPGEAHFESFGRGYPARWNSNRD
jgi:hypothetical protein